MVNINTDKVSKQWTDMLVFTGPAGSGKTVSLVKAACSCFSFKFEDDQRRFFAYDPHGDIKRVFDIPQLSEWCDVTEEFKKAIIFLEKLSDLPQDLSDSTLMIDASLTPTLLREINDIIAFHKQEMLFSIFMTRQVNRNLAIE